MGDFFQLLDAELAEEIQAGRLLTGEEELFPHLLQLQIAELTYAARLAGIKEGVYLLCLLQLLDAELAERRARLAGC
jgi:hypothetical protein